MVAPFNLLVDMSPEAAPQILINRENTLPVYDFTKGPNRLFLPGNCDDTIMQIVQEAGWQADFDKIIKEYDEKHRKKPEESKEVEKPSL